MTFAAREISFRYRRDQPDAVHGVSLTVEREETLGIVGESGSGKSTLARCLCGLLTPSGGSISLDGRDLVRSNRRARLDFYRSVQMIFQDPDMSLPQHLPVRLPLMDAAALRTRSREERRRRAERLIRELGLPADTLQRRPRELSGGQRQRIAIARAVISNPSVLVLDEPTSALDLPVRNEILTLLKGVQREGRMAYVLITHDMALAALMCDRIAVLKDGRIVETGASRELISRPTHPYTRRLLAAVPTRDPEHPRILRLERD